MRNASHISGLLALFVLCALAAIPMACDTGGTSPPEPKPLPGQWEPLGLEGEPVGDIKAIAVHPENPDVLYAAGWGGLFKTADGGETWDTLRTEDIYSDVQISSPAPEVVYAVDQGIPSTIIKSTDSGETWEKVADGFNTSSTSWTSIALDPRTPDVLYAVATGTHGGCPFKTADGGESWKALSGPTGLCDSGTGIAVNPASPEVIYVGKGGELLESPDGGATWASVRSGLVGFIHFAPASGALYASMLPGLHRSTDGGETWKVEVVADSVTGLFQMAFRPQAGERYLATREGVYLSRADSAWVEVSTGLPHRWVNEIAVGAAGNRLYAGLKRVSGRAHGLYVRELTDTQSGQ